MASSGLLVTPLLGPSDALTGPTSAPGWSDSERRRTFLAVKKILDVAQSGVRDREVHPGHGLREEAGTREHGRGRDVVESGITVTGLKERSNEMGPGIVLG